VKDREIDEILAQAGRSPHPVDPELLDRIAGSVGSSLEPVRPLAPAWILSAGLLLAAAAVAVGVAARLGMHGIEGLSAWQRALIFPALGILVWQAALAGVREITPGSRRAITPALLLVAVCAALVTVFGAVFYDYGTGDFVPGGLKCLMAGLAAAVPAAAAAGLVLRRGYAVNPLSAGLAVGMLAGLAGTTMLELHCPNFQAPHVMLWHTAVIAIGGGVGALVAGLRRAVSGRSATARAARRG